MRISYHFVISSIVFGIVYKLGYPLQSTLIAYTSSLIIDIDHLFFGKKYLGKFNLIEIYHLCYDDKWKAKFTPKQFLSFRFLNIRLFPLHNVFVILLLFILIPPVGVGLFFHVALDLSEHFFVPFPGRK
jgi:hypothetical protein